MSNTDLWSSAKQGDIQAISSLIQREFDDESINIKAQMQLGVTLWLKLYSSKTLEPQLCTEIVIQSLNKIQPQNITSVRLALMASNSSGKDKAKWNRYIAIKQGEFADNTKNANLIGYILILLILSWAGCSTLTNKPNSSPTPTSAQPLTQMKDPNCLYVPESVIAGKTWQEINDFKASNRKKMCSFYWGLV